VTYWVLKCGGEYRLFCDSSHGSVPLRKWAVKFPTREKAVEARDDSCCPDLWRVVRVVRKGVK